MEHSGIEKSVEIMKKDYNCNSLPLILPKYGTLVHFHHSEAQFNFYFMAQTSCSESLTDDSNTKGRIALSDPDDSILYRVVN